MWVISKRQLREFWQSHADAEHPLRAWHAEVEAADWHGPEDIKARYAHASFLPSGRVVFNIKGNKYRLVVVVRFDLHKVFVRFVGTHAQYDKIDASTV